MRHIAFLILALALSACNGVPISTLWKLRHFNLVEADISKLRIAARGPDWIIPTPEKGQIDVSYWREGAENEKREQKIRLRRGAHPEDEAELARLAGGAPVVVYEAAPRDLPVARAIQDEIEKARREGVKLGGGTVLLGGAPACRSGEVPSRPIILIDAYIHADDETGWLPLYSQHSVPERGWDDNAEREFQTLVPPCGKSAARVEPPNAAQ